MKTFVCKLACYFFAVTLLMPWGQALATMPPENPESSFRYPWSAHWTATVMVSGSKSGTTFIKVDLSREGAVPLGRERVPGSQSSQGGYLAPDGRLFIGGFAGGGMQIFRKFAAGWRLQKVVPAPRASSFSAVDLKDPWQNPVTGQLSVNDIASGSELFFDLARESWSRAGVMRGAAVCDTTYDADGTAWSTGYTGLYRSTAINPLLPDPKYITSLRQSQMFAYNGSQYLAVADGESGDVRFVRASGDCSAAGRTRVVDGEAFGLAIFNNEWLVVSDRSNGDLVFLQVRQPMRRPNGDRIGPVAVSLGPDVRVVGKIAGSYVNGGQANDVAGVGFVTVDGAWTDN